MEMLKPREAVNQAILFTRLRWRLVRNSALQLVRASKVRPITVCVACLLVWGFVFGISLSGFRFLHEQRLPFGGNLVGMLLDLMFVTLAGMLVFSTGLVIYGSLFSAAETNYLLSKPVSDDQVFAYKFQGALAFSSTAFLLLGSPVLIAFGLVCEAPWFFYVMLPLFFLGFVLIPGSVGALACLLIVNFIPRRCKQVVVLVILLLVTLTAVWITRIVNSSTQPTQVMSREQVNRLIGRFSFAGSIYMPSHWVRAGLQSAGHGQVGTSLYHLMLVWTNGLFLYLIAAWGSAKLYRRGFNRVTTGGELKHRYGGHWLDHILTGCLFFVRPATRLLIVKDFRTFRRDPQQWAQIVIFGGLITLYMMNIRKMFLGEIGWVYQNSISLLNLSAISLLVCIYTGRFIYPMLSLEGRKMWLLGLLPLERDQLLWGKFAFSATGAVLISSSLIILSDVKLEMPLEVILLHVLTIGVLSAGLSGLSVGLGAWTPNFRETDPSKIAVGLGGTLNLVASLLFMLVVLALMAFPWHFQMLSTQSATTGPEYPWLWWIGATLGAGVGAVAVVVPLRLGIRALRGMEF
jgi:ABC-2 type transport system permease protein